MEGERGYHYTGITIGVCRSMTETLCGAYLIKDEEFHYSLLTNCLSYNVNLHFKLNSDGSSFSFVC